MSAAGKQVSSPGPMVVSSRLKTIFAILIFVGLAGFIVGLISNADRAWHAYLVAMFYFVSLALGGIFFAAIQYITSAGWSVTVRRFSEAFSAFLPLAGVLVIIFAVFGASHIYEWLNAAAVAHDELLQHKSAYLNGPFFWVRTLVFLAIWLGFAHVLVNKSTQQDKTGDAQLTLSATKPAIIFVLLFALSYTFFSIDTLMSLDPHWFSTIYGVYCFGGLFQSTMAAMILVTIYFMNKGQLQGFVDENHLHDLGKFLFAFTVFWAYIAFSQYMLMWYANLPEETTFFIPRSQGSWMVVSLGLLIFKFVVPFFALLPRWAKRSTTHLTAVSCLILIMQFVDIYWLVYPQFNEHEPVFGLTEICAFCAVLGLFLFAVTRFLSKNSIVAYRDPRLHEAMHHHVTY